MLGLWRNKAGWQHGYQGADRQGRRVDKQDVVYSEYQQMIKIHTDVQNTNRHYPAEKNVQNTKKRRSKYQQTTLNTKKNTNFWYYERWYFELDPYLIMLTAH